MTVRSSDMNGAFQCNLCGACDFDRVITKNAHQLVRCRACGLLCIDPQPSREQIAALYAPASGYQRHRLQASNNRYAPFEDRRSRYLADVVDREHARRGALLDVGCGTGAFLHDMQKRGWKVCGLELGEHQVEHARTAHNLDVQAGAAEDATARFAATSFDVITLWDVVEHLPSPRQVVTDLVTLLKPGGTLFLATPNEDGWVARAHWQTIRRAWGVWPHPEPPRHLFQFSRTTIRKLCDAAGLAQIDVRHDEIPLWYSAGFAGVPTMNEWLHGEPRAPRARLLYAVSVPVFAAARLAGRGDSMIVRAARPLVPRT